jgi:hypothetical protein
MYQVVYSVSAQCSVAGKHIEAGIEISGSGSATGDGRCHVDSPTGNTQITLSSVTILDLAANDTIEIALRTTDIGAPTISIDHINITLTQIGGT